MNKPYLEPDKQVAFQLILKISLAFSLNKLVIYVEELLY